MQVVKRDGRIVDFDKQKILAAIEKANVVGKKTGELVDTSKLKLQAVDLNSDIKRNYEALGRAVYESRKQGETGA